MSLILTAEVVGRINAKKNVRIPLKDIMAKWEGKKSQ
jgi:hypothetical protein